MKKSHTMRLDSDLLKEVDKERKKQKPVESKTRFFETAAWERIDRINKQVSPQVSPNKAKLC